MTEALSDSDARLDHRLWHSFEPMERRWEKSAAALVAVARTLEEEGASAAVEREFLELYAWAASRPAAAFTEVWKAPLAFAWVRGAYEAYGRHLSAGAPPDAFRECLAHFRALVLGVALECGEDLTLSAPYRTALPFALPGTTRVLEGEGVVEITGCRDGRLRWQGAAADERDAPVVRVGEARVQLNPYALRGLGADFPEVGRGLAAGLDYHAAQAETVRVGLELVQRHAPEVFHQFAGVVRCLALKPSDRSDDISNVSLTELPGAFVALVVGFPYDLADTFVHEFHHNRLFFLEEETPLFEPDQNREVGSDMHYSPWRGDLRPLRGLLHAIYVTVPVTRFWLAVRASGELTGDEAAYADDRILRADRQFGLGLEGVERFGRLTPDGKEVFARIRAAVSALRADIAAALPESVPAFYCTAGGRVKPMLEDGRQIDVDRSVRLHVERYDALGEFSSRA